MEADRRESLADSLESGGLRALALGLGVFALLLDFVPWWTILGAMLGLVGGGYALLTPRGRLRTAALMLNGLAFFVAAALLLSFFL